MFKKIQYFILTFFLFLLISLVILFYYVSSDLPSYKKLSTYYPSSVNNIYSRDGVLIDQFGIESRIFIPIKYIPKNIINAFIATEDHNFYSHKGIDYYGLIRAILSNIKHFITKTKFEGASTITQQVVKNLLLSSERSIIRKVKEAILSYRISKVFSKDEILEIYLNQIYLGQASYGIASACYNYFGKSIDEINLMEAALIASLAKSPSKVNPVQNYEKSLQRRNYVLFRMYKEKFITEYEYNKAKSYDINLDIKKEKSKIHAPYYSQIVKQELQSILSKEIIEKGGLSIFTSMNSKYQILAENSFKKGVGNLKNNQDLNQPEINGAMIGISSHTGDVLFEIGGYNFAESNFDRSRSALRQVGSLAKTYVYLGAFENNISPNTIFTDKETIIDLPGEGNFWSPRNWNHTYQGDMTLRQAYEQSVNSVTVQIAEKIGLLKVKEIIERLGVNDNVPLLHSISLGSFYSTLEKVTNSYAIIANGGYKIKPHYIKYISDRNGNIIYQVDNAVLLDNKDFSDELSYPRIIVKNKDRLIDSAYNFQIISLLKGAVERGLAKSANIKGIEQGGKTGTTNSSKDHWFVGISDYITVGVYIGHDIPKSMGDSLYSKSTTIPIYFNFMNSIKETLKNASFKIPSTVFISKVDQKTGLYSKTEGSIDEFFTIKQV